MSTEPIQHQQLAALGGPRFDLLVLEFAATAMSQALEAFGSLNSALLFTATARTSGPFGQQNVRKRPVSVNALAASLGRPFETTRRHANALIEQGILVRAPGGLSVPIQAISDPRVARMVDNCHDALVRLVEHARAGNQALPPARGELSYDPRAGIGIALDLLLAAIECHSKREDHFTRLALLLAIEWAHQHYSSASSGNGPSQAIRISTAARIVGLPYATASRNIEALLARGLLRRVPDGLVPVEETPLAAECRTALANRARQLIGRLAQTGFPMHQPASAYIRRQSAQSVIG